MNIFELEKHLIPFTEWEEKVPKFVRDMVDLDDGQPTGIGYTEKTGWYILGTGQGPFVVWMEKLTCERCGKEIEREETDDPHYPDGKPAGVFGFHPLEIWLCYDCNEEYKNSVMGTDKDWEILEKFLEEE